MKKTFLEKFDVDYYLQFDDIAQAFSPTAYTDEDLNIGLLVARQILELHKDVKPKEPKDIPVGELLKDALYQINLMGCSHVVKDAVSLLNNMDYVQLENTTSSTFIVNSSVVETNNGIAKNPVVMFIPECLTDISKYFMAHEITHILKERNPEECKSIYTVSEMTPMLMELILAINSRNPMVIRSIFQERCSLLYAEALNLFDILREIKVEHSSSINSALKVALGLNLSYLISFYYSLALFNIYLKDSDFIIDLVRDNLVGKITSREMIEKVKSYNDSISCDDDYKDGLQIFKKGLK